MPAIYPYRYFSADGGLISYGPDQLDQWRGVQAPTKYELAINLKTAKTLGMTVPSSLIATADEVIE